MYWALIVLHVIVCSFLVLVVLLQAGKGGGVGIAFGGGGSQTVFGSSGAGNFLTKMTAACATIFFLNSIGLAYFSSQSDSRRLKDLAAQKAAKKVEMTTKPTGATPTGTTPGQPSGTAPTSGGAPAAPATAPAAAIPTAPTTETPAAVPPAETAKTATKAAVPPVTKTKPVTAKKVPVEKTDKAESPGENAEKPAGETP